MRQKNWEIDDLFLGWKISFLQLGVLKGGEEGVETGHLKSEKKIVKIPVESTESSFSHCYERKLNIRKNNKLGCFDLVKSFYRSLTKG